MKMWIFWASALAVLTTAGCYSHHDINMTHEVKPIHITLDVNLTVARELDDFFGDIDQASSTVKSPAE